MSTPVTFLNSTYFINSTLSTIGASAFVVGVDVTNNRYFRMDINELRPSLSNTGSGAELISLDSASDTFTQKRLAVTNLAGNTSSPLQINDSTTLSINFDQDKINADNLNITFTPSYYSDGDNLAAHLTNIDTALSDLNDAVSTNNMYDSGWKAVPARVVNGASSYGTVSITNTPFDYSGLQYRVMGRQVFIRGTLYIPLAATAEGAPITNYTTTLTTDQTYVAVGYNTGWWEDTLQSGQGSAIVKRTTFNSNYLKPELEHYLGEVTFRRYVRMKDEGGSDIASQYGLLTARCRVSFNSDGEFFIWNDLGTTSIYGIGAQLAQSAWGTSVVRSGDYAISQQLWSTDVNSELSPEGGMATSDANQWKNDSINYGYGNTFNTTPPYTSAKFNLDFNGQVTSMGGFYANIDFSYLIDSDVSIANIQSAVALN